MGNPVDLVINVNGVREVVGKAWFDPVAGEGKFKVNNRIPQSLKDLIWQPVQPLEIAFSPQPPRTL